MGMGNQTEPQTENSTTRLPHELRMYANMERKTKSSFTLFYYRIKLNVSYIRTALYCCLLPSLLYAHIDHWLSLGKKYLFSFRIESLCRQFSSWYFHSSESYANVLTWTTRDTVYSRSPSCLRCCWPVLSSATAAVIGSQRTEGCCVRSLVHHVVQGTRSSPFDPMCQ